MTVSSPLSFFTFRSEVIVEIGVDPAAAGAGASAANDGTRHTAIRKNAI
ncbi:MAG: hypothetical protein IPK98_04680 [Chloracidobacterium sp.]|nr:hypothetical protein [Chloracidobacterium sp.]